MGDVERCEGSDRRHLRLVRLGAVAALALAALGGMTAVADASPNNAPSKAGGVTVGVPFTGNWDGTVRLHDNGFNHWWTSSATLRAGDVLQFAVDNRASESGLYLCLVPPVDGFGADDALDDCSWEYVADGRQDRIEITYGGSSGQAYLVASLRHGGGGETAESGIGQYTIIVERQITRVSPGLAVPAKIARSFALTAHLRYGDNTPVADGIGAALQWRYAPARGEKAADFATLATGTSSGGGVTFAARLPAAARGQVVQMRACASQPGGSSVACSTPAKATVAAPSAECRTARRTARRSARAVRVSTARQAKLTRKVRRLKRKAGKASRPRARRVYRRRLRRTKQAWRATRRELKVANRKLARSRRAARRHCP